MESVGSRVFGRIYGDGTDRWRDYREQPETNLKQEHFSEYTVVDASDGGTEIATWTSFQV